MSKEMFFGGIPTEIDVMKLKKEFPISDITDGWIVEAEAIAKTIGVGLHTPRFQTVTSKWRKDLEKDHNIFIGRKNKQFILLDDPLKLDLSRRKMKTSYRCARRSVTVLSHTNYQKLSQDDKAVHDTMSRRAAAILAAAAGRTLEQ